MKSLFAALSDPALLYLDSAATTHKPKQVIEAITSFYAKENATVHRSLYPKALQASKLYQDCRKKVANLINAEEEEIIFTKGTTDSLNLVAHFLSQILKPHDVIALSPFSHHANYLPWIQLKKRLGVELFFFSHLEDRSIDYEDLQKRLPKNTKAILATHISNVTGDEIDLSLLSTLAKERDAFFVVDAAQSIAHRKIDVKGDLIDFLAFSSHKMYGPTGVGVLFGKKEHLERFEPLVFGGDMVSTIEGDVIIYQPPPLKFEAGTPPIASVIGLSHAIDFLNQVGIDSLFSHDRKLGKLYREALKEIPGLRWLSSPASSAIHTFIIEGIHPFDLSLLLGEKGIQIRSGHLCAQPALKELGVESVARLSVGIYNDEEEVVRFIKALHSIVHSYR